MSFFFSFHTLFFPPVSESKELPEVVRTVLKQEITRLFGDSNARSFNQAYLSKHSNSIPHRLAGRPHTHTHTFFMLLCNWISVNVSPDTYLACCSILLLLELLSK